MAREVRKLKALQITSLPTGTHSDGGNLLLRVKGSGSRSWLFRYKQNGRAIELGLGSTNDRSLAEARDTANDMRRAIAREQSPKDVLRVEKPGNTFAEYALECIEQKSWLAKNQSLILVWETSRQHSTQSGKVRRKPPQG